MSRLFAIGDIHGHHAELTALMKQLIEKVGLRPQRDTVVFLGDYVDGGPAVKQVLDTLIEWQAHYPHWQFLKGNHEDMMLDALVYNSARYGFYGHWWGQGGKETANSYLPQNASDYERAIMQPAEFILTSHLDWLNHLPLRYEQDGYVFVHAGFAPRISLDGQRERDMLWIRDAFINSDWDFDGQRVVFGHTPFETPLVMPNKIGIDTMFHDAGSLTAVELNTEDAQGAPSFFSSGLVQAW
ncbi:MAG: metallophosphoesterase family protein [Thermomicrobiales bacterium]